MIRQTCSDEIRAINADEIDAVSGGNKALAEGAKIVVAWLVGKILDGSKNVHPQDSRVWKNLEAGRPWWE